MDTLTVTLTDLMLADESARDILGGEYDMLTAYNRGTVCAAILWRRATMAAPDEHEWCDDAARDFRDLVGRGNLAEYVRGSADREGFTVTV